MKWSMVYKWGLLMLVFTGLTGCAGLRSEFYRNEVAHLYKSATRAYEARKMETARKLFLKIIALDPGCAEAHVGLGHICRVNGDHGAAGDHYQTALKIDPGLEATVTPHLMQALKNSRLAPLMQTGLRLVDIYKRLQADDPGATEALLTPAVPLHLLATDTTSVPLAQQPDLTQKIETLARTPRGKPRWRLFMAFYLAHTRQYDHLALQLAEAVLPRLATADLPATHRLRGLLYRRLGQPNQAVEAFLAAYKTGAPAHSVAHQLALIYRIPLPRVQKGLAQSKRSVMQNEESHR